MPHSQFLWNEVGGLFSLILQIVPLIFTCSLIAFSAALNLHNILLYNFISVHFISISVRVFVQMPQHAMLITIVNVALHLFFFLLFSFVVFSGA